MTDADLLRTIKRLALEQLVELRARPKPTYELDGQRVSWETYAASLERTVAWCGARLAAEEPFEFRSQGATS